MSEDARTIDASASEDDAARDAQARKGLVFRLGEGAEESGAAAPRPTQAPAERLSDAETARVLQRLPPLKADEADAKEFALRERSLPAPRAGATVLNAFPSDEERRAPDADAGRELRVVRYSPQGDVPLAPQLSVTFSQPMVAITSQEDAALVAPVRMSPQPPGRWRWLGTKTLVFDPEAERLPMATEFTVSIPAGTRAASNEGGGATMSPVTWKFSTPPPKLLSKYPSDIPARRDAIIFLAFDQKVNPEAVLRTVRVNAGARTLKVRLASETEVNGDGNVKGLAQGAGEGRWLALRAVGEDGEARDALPQDSPVNVTVGPGTPSAEGPRTTATPQAFSFRTYGALRVTNHECGYNKRCSPRDNWSITFSNPLDREAFDPAQVKIEPEVPNATINVYGQTMYISGAKRGRTTYKVTLDSSLRDDFGQALGASAPLTFNVGAADPALLSTGNFVVLEPSNDPRLSVYTINHAALKVSLYAVAPEDYERYVAYMRFVSGYYSEGERKQTTPPGRLVASKTVQVRTSPDETVETKLDLAPALRQGLGNVFVVVEPTMHAKGSEREALRTWVQVTGIGLDAFADREQLIGWATALGDGRPLEGVELSLHPTGVRATSGRDGTVRLALPAKAGAPTSLLLARRGADTAFLPERSDWWGDTSAWVRSEAGEELRWYVFDDRKMYRPDEEVSVKGWLRRVGAGRGGDVGALAGAAESVSYTLSDSRGNEVLKGSARLNALGGFDAKLKLPATMNLGAAALRFQAAGGSGAGSNRDHYHSFQVQEFRRPEFEVSAHASEGPFFVGGHAQATVSASYYAGGGLADAEVNWRVTAATAQFTPPNLGDYTFGKWTPWWERASGSYSSRTPADMQTYKAKTDASGRHVLRLDFDSVNPPQPSTVTAEASVTDVNRQTWTSATTMLVHASQLYVGLKSERLFVEEGQPLVVSSIVSDIDGRLVAGREVRMRAALLEWKFSKGKWSQVESRTEECVIKSASDAVKCTFRPKAGGMYRVTARVLDDHERPNESELTLWVAGGKQPPERGVEQQKVELIPGARDYRAGETAEILVQSPFAPAEAILTLRRSGLVRTERFRMDGPSHTLKIPVEDAYTPNLHVQVDLVGAAARTNDKGEADENLPKRPAFASGEINLSVPPLARKLQVVATPRERALEPGGETTVAVEVKDASGRAMQGSELAVVVVDESVLALTGYKLDDPLSIFYSERGADVTDYHLRQNVLLRDPGDIGTGAGGGGATAAYTIYDGAANMNAQLKSSPAPPPVRAMRSRSSGVPEAEADESAEQQQAIRMRADFNALAVFAPSVTTDAQGRAEVKVKVPDNLTRYRVMAVSVAGGRQFGSGESSITARQPLMVRPSAPRFLNFGDRFELPVVIQNQTDKTAEVDVAVRAANAELTEGQGRRVRVPANDRVEVRFPASASRAGKATFQVGAMSGRFADAAQVELPVWTPATTEAFATYGELDASGAIVQPVKAPANVFKQFGGLEVQTSSTQLQALTDAVLYLVAYPYECSEQLSSRVMAVAALRDVLTAFKAEGMPKPEEMKAAVARDIERLKGMQNDDGGFGFWRRGDQDWPYLGIHVAHALTRAKEKGYDVPQTMLDRSKSYLRAIESHIPKRYGRDARNSLIAYALYTRARMNDADAARARKLIADNGLEKLPLEAIGWLLPTLSADKASATETAAIRRLLDNRAEETAATAHFVTSYADDDYLLLRSDRRADGVILEALIGDEPASDLIPKIARGLLAHRTKGRWENTQENAFVLLALDRYFRTYEKATPDFVARAWLGDAYAGEQQFKGRSTDRQQFDVPMSYMAEKAGGAPQNLVLQKEGAGRLYYRIGMQYAPSSLKLAPADYGFTVERAYEAVDNPSDVRRDADGIWHIKAGAKVRVRLTMVAPTRRYHVALVDPLPAGLEALNPALAVTGSVPEDDNSEVNAKTSPFGWWWWSRPWFEHQNLRDERAEAFASLLWEGVYNYTYFARATTPGTFVVPPPKAEEMYHPETFGRGATDRVIVE
ncbi:MAG: alpha-2-macroglobulin family protein [Pyrinomonadaceae bacterium]